METINLILKIFVWAAVAITVLALVSPPERIRELLQRFFLFVQGPADMLRQGCRTVLQNSWAAMQQAAHSVGISGEHWVQRIVGGILISAAAILGLFVGTLNLMVVIGGVFGSAADTVVEHLPLSLETLTAIELGVAAFVFGFLLLDTLDITHTTKFYSGSNLKPWLKNSFSMIFVLGAIYSIYLFASSGIVRTESIFPQAEAGASVPKASNETTTGAIYLPNSQTSHIATSEINLGINEEATPVSEAYESAASGLMIGIPLVSVASGIFAGVALIVLASMVVTFPLFLAIGSIFGIGWSIAAFAVRMIDLLYNFVLAFVNFFAELGQSIRRLVTNRTLVSDNGGINATELPPQPDTSNSHEMPADGGGQPAINQTQPTNNRTTPAQNSDGSTVDPLQNQQGPGDQNSQQGQQAQQEPLYRSDDPNWNPLQ